MTEQRKLKCEIISFVQNSPEEVNSKLAILIAGMQAQKNLMECRQKIDREKFCVAKNTSVKKQGG